MSIFNILIVCTGNTCRSPMAEGLLRHFLPSELSDRVKIDSAGTSAIHGDHPQPFAVSAVKEYGADITTHRAKMIHRNILKQSSLILTMENTHIQAIKKYFFFKKLPVRLLADFHSHEDLTEISDPFGKPLEAYRSCARLINQCIGGVVDHLR